jgi:threonine dehydrogenase-like Zn-dependent dehydrogenase
MNPMPLVAIDVDPRRTACGRTLGAHVGLDASPGGNAASETRRLTGGGVDVAIEASGTDSGLELAVSVVRRGGRVHLVGLPAQPSSLDLHHCIVNEIDFSSSNGHVCREDIPAALDLLTSRWLAPLVTDRVIELDQLVPEGLEPVAAGQTHGKVIVAVNGGTR